MNCNVIRAVLINCLSVNSVVIYTFTTLFYSIMLSLLSFCLVYLRQIMDAS